jgi:murein DD-endopeptidase MepM/ murein hydrolase activator NlpD
MASPRAYSGPLRESGDRQRRRRVARRWKIGALLVATAVLVTVLLAAFSAPPPSFQASLRDDSSLIATGRPVPQVIAFQDDLRIQLPVSQQSVTALGYHGSTSSALPLDPVGRQANEGILARILHRLTGADASGVTYYQLNGGSGPRTGALDVGAPAGTSVYAPVAGTVVSIRDYILDGKQYGHRIDIVPDEAPSVVVSVTRLRADPALTVGSPVTAATSKIGVVLDLSRAEKQALAGVTGDPGNHVTLEVHPAATLTY